MPAAAKKSIRDLVASVTSGPSEKVEVPEWKQDNGDPIVFEMRGMTTGARGRFMQSFVQPDGTVQPNFERYFSEIVVVTAYDPETGERAFEDSDVQMLNNIPAGPVERLAQIGLRLSGLDEGSIEEGKGGSSSTETADSSSSSPPTST